MNTATITVSAIKHKVNADIDAVMAILLRPQALTSDARRENVIRDQN